MIEAALFFIGCPLWVIAVLFWCLFDDDKRALRMVDVDRASVYSKHLGKNLREG